MEDSSHPILDDARKAGIDLDLMDTLLAQSVTERWQQHAGALALAMKLETAMKARDAGLRQPLEATR